MADALRRQRGALQRKGEPSASQPAKCPTAGQPTSALLADLGDARLAERVAAWLLEEARKQVAATVLAAKDAGVGYDRMAQHTLHAVHRSTVTLLERRREAVRLRKLVHRRRRVTAGHGYPPAAHGTSPVAASPSIATGGESMTQKLISRKTIEERFVDSDEDEHLDEGNDLEGEDEREEDEHEPPRAARPRR